MSLKLVLGLSIVCGGSHPAAAERTIVIELLEPAPFEAIDLARALRLRLPAEGPPVRVQVSRTLDGVRVDTVPGSREIALDGIAGPSAARLVALAAGDLLLADLATVPELVVRSPPAAAPATTPGAPIEVGVLGAAAAWDGALGALWLDLSVPRRGMLASVELGGGGLVGGPVALLAGLVRIDGGVRVGLFELRAGLTIAPIVARTGAGDLTILAGGNASARLRIPVTRGSRAVLGAGADLFATRTEYLLDGASVMTTPRIAPWVAAGMEVAL